MTTKPRTYDPADFGDLSEILVSEPKVLPVDGQLYEFPGDVSAETYRLMMRVLSVAVRAANGTLVDGEAETLGLDEAAAEKMRAETLGDGGPAMEAAGVHPKKQSFVETTLFIWHTQGKDAALTFWKSGGQGNPQGPANREARRAAAKGSKKKTSSKS